MQERGEDIPTGIEGEENPLGVATEEVDLETDDISGLTTKEITELALEKEASKAESPGGESLEATKPAKAEKGQGAPEGFVAAPNRLSQTDKEVFNSLPPALKMATARMFRDIENQGRRRWAEMSQATQAAAGLVTNVHAYLTQRPRLVEAGYTAPRLVNELLGAHMALENPSTKLGKYAEIGSQLDLSDQEFAQVAQAIGKGHLVGGAVEGVAPQADISNHPTVLALREQISALQQNLNPVISGYQQAQEQQFSATVESWTAEGTALQSEKDQFGRLRYPELRNDDFLEQAKPLVDNLGRTLPDIGFGDRLRIAYHMLHGMPAVQAIAKAEAEKSGNPTQAISQRLPNTTTATRAAISARGRGTPAGTSQAESQDEIPEDVMRRGTRAITEWSLNRLRSGARA